MFFIQQYIFEKKKKTFTSCISYPMCLFLFKRYSNEATKSQRCRNEPKRTPQMTTARLDDVTMIWQWYLIVSAMPLSQNLGSGWWLYVNLYIWGECEFQLVQWIVLSVLSLRVICVTTSKGQWLIGIKIYCF